MGHRPATQIVSQTAIVGAIRGPELSRADSGEVLEYTFLSDAVSFSGLQTVFLN
jgi:hypothetical protein